MATITAFAPGKMILSGEYAVVFGEQGIAVPTATGVEATWTDGPESPMRIVLEGQAGEEAYARGIVERCIGKGGHATGTLTIHNDIPVGRGMGSSTGLVIAICKCLLGEKNKPEAILVEDIVNPGNSGLDFAVIWAKQPMIFRRGTTPEPMRLPEGLLKNSILIDTGKPGEITAELVAWMTLRQAQGDKAVLSAFKTIGACTERILKGENLQSVMRDHHRAQIALGVVPPQVQELIAGIEAAGGSAKVLGAGSRTGGGGMVLALHEHPGAVQDIASKAGLPVR